MASSAGSENPRPSARIQSEDDQKTWVPDSSDSQEPSKIQPKNEVAGNSSPVPQGPATVRLLSTGDEISDQTRESTLPDETVEGYRLIREIHRGGQGVVYEAFQKATYRKVALKVLLGGSFAGETAKRRFEREIELAANLRHRHIVAIYDSGITKGHYYLVMDYVDGLPLDDYVQQKSLSVRQKLEVFAKVCSAVTFAHQHGVIHRDLKPSNILVNREGEPLVLDFGLAKRIEELDRTSFSMEGQILGTPQYMAPEQAEGRTDEIDARTDVYALGVILYKLLTGRHPYPVNGRLSDVLSNIVQVEPVRPSKLAVNLDRDLEVMVLKTLAKEPARRYQSAAELERDIEFWLQGLPILARSVSSTYLVRKLIARHRYTSTVVGLLLVIVLAFAAVSFHLYRAAETARLRAEQFNTALAADADFGRRVGFEFFLRAWQTGRPAEARALVNYLAPNSRERKAIQFLIDNGPISAKAGTYRAAVEEEDRAFAEFVIAEGYVREGKVKEAITAYRQSEERLQGQRSGASDRWLAVRVKGRLDQLINDRIDTPPASRPHGAAKP